MASTRCRARRAAWLAPAAYAGLLVALSARPGASLPSFTVPGLDKFVHVALYVPLGLLLARAVGPGRGALAVGLAVAFGATDELHQAFVPGRTPSFADLIADGIGATLGALVWTRRAARLSLSPSRE